MLFSVTDAGRAFPEQIIFDRLEEIARALGWPRAELSAVIDHVLPDEDGDDRPLPEPTRCLPLTPGKEKVMAERLRRGEQLFHPDDAQYPHDGHEERSGIKKANGYIDILAAQSAERDGHSIVISDNPVEAAQTLQIHFKLPLLRIIVETLWRECGVRAGGVDLPVREPVRPAREKNRRRKVREKGVSSWRQLSIWPEPEAA